jgi:hypothetical protein
VRDTIAGGTAQDATAPATALLACRRWSLRPQPHCKGPEPCALRPRPSHPPKCVLPLLAPRRKQSNGLFRKIHSWPLS